MAARLKQKNLKLHGWVYHIAKGTVTQYSPRRDKFVRIRIVKSQKTKTGKRGTEPVGKRSG